MERDGYLTSRNEHDGRTVRKFYTITDNGSAGPIIARLRLRELVREAGQE